MITVNTCRTSYVLPSWAPHIKTSRTPPQIPQFTNLQTSPTSPIPPQIFPKSPISMASPAFSAYRLNHSTFRITENSLLTKSSAEKPQIYLKFYDALIVVIDTGSARKPDDQNITLRQFIETVPVAANGGKPLNEGGRREYTLVMTHCHFDRIGIIFPPN